MFESRLLRPGWALVAACCSAVLLASLAAGKASGADCTADNVFRMGTTNTCIASTSLAGSAFTQLSVSNSTPTGVAILGLATATTGSGAGVEGDANSGGANTYGVYGVLLTSSAHSHSAGVYGKSYSTNGNGPGVYGESTFSNGSNGVQGVSHNPVASGVYGENLSGGYGLAGRANGDTSGGTNIAVLGELTSSSPLAGAAAVRGFNQGTNANGYGVFGSHAGSGIGVLGTSPTGIGVFGLGTFGVIGYGVNGPAGYFFGDVNVTGTLTKGAGAFRIDHPLDPAHKYLQHSFVESPDMMDVYNGNVTTNGKGFATVKLPAYFQALNRSFRYQLTLVGRQAWGAQAVVWQKIRHNSFVIRSSRVSRSPGR